MLRSATFMWDSLPAFGTSVLYAILVAAAYTFAVAVSAGRGHPRLLRSARLGAYATSALVLLGVLVLAYAFITHDFRIRYVSRYSDRSMSGGFLVAALWGGQDGSLLWWAFLLAGYTAACVKWLEGRYRQLQPYVIATLMVITSFFAVLMLFAANPFEVNVAGTKLDGEGLNPLLQNFYMIIHPPSLYMGFVGCSVPFAFAVAALVTGRLDNEWIVAVRKWMLFAWLFLSIGNALGMLWAYEELGWGGYWAWDPVENAACLPWFSASAYVHSTMIQERRGMLKAWNVVLIVITFLLTIFGTFLTRSGLISSVHSFAQSDIGIFFVAFMGFVVAVSAALIVWRLPLLRSRGQIEGVLSREAAFVVNNWVLLACATFILVATTWPKLSELFLEEVVTVGPPFFNRWMAPLGLTLLALMGVAPLLAWRRTSGESLRRAFAVPTAMMAAVMGLHLWLGAGAGFPALVEQDQFYPGVVGVLLQKLGAAAPLVTVGLVAFNFAVIGQEFWRGASARRRKHGESWTQALIRLTTKNRRRYGGYTVHAGIGLMFLGFVGRSWEIEHETSMKPGDTYELAGYTLRYEGPRMEVDASKRMIFADLSVEHAGAPLGRLSPARFIYNKGAQPTTEVSILRRLRNDLYVVVGTVDSASRKATFRFHVNPLVNLIWTGVLILMLGTSLSLWPEVKLREIGVWGAARLAATTAGIVAFVVLLSTTPARASTSVDDVVGWRTVPVVSRTETQGSGPLLPAGLAAGAGLLLGALVIARGRTPRMPR
jgi:cytochrome c-type biogenesis protein CcmF